VNLDIIQTERKYFLGETTYSEKLIIETPSYTWDNITSWENLARLSITMQQEETKIITNDMDFNFLNITIESIYNLPNYFTKEMDYKCGTTLYSDKDV
jgi:hypothetical protein